MSREEEWQNFMHRVGEVSQLVKDLASKDKLKSSAASILANKYLEEKDITIRDGEVGLEMRVKSDRTVINQKAFNSLGKETNPDGMDPEVWMAEMSKDADKRAADRKVRQEKADTLKTQAARAFRRKEYASALSYYNKAIEHVRDSALLYTHRALTLLKLRKYDRVAQDCEWALRLNEDSFKARLYRAKAHKELEQAEEFEASKKELAELFPQHQHLTEEFLNKEESDEDERD